jgi:hypothetical protein
MVSSSADLYIIAGVTIVHSGQSAIDTPCIIRCSNKILQNIQVPGRHTSVHSHIGSEEQNSIEEPLIQVRGEEGV